MAGEPEVTINKPAALPRPAPLPSQREVLRRARLSAGAGVALVCSWFALPVSFGGFGGSSNLSALLSGSSEGVLTWWVIPVLSLFGSVIDRIRGLSGIGWAVTSVLGVVLCSFVEPLGHVGVESTCVWGVAIAVTFILAVRRARADRRSRDQEAESWAEPRRALDDFVPYPRDGFFKRSRRR